MDGLQTNEQQKNKTLANNYVNKNCDKISWYQIDKTEMKEEQKRWEKFMYLRNMWS